MNQRCLTILDLLNREETLDVNDLAERLDVSAVTVRKDLAILENKGFYTGSTAAPCAFHPTTSAIA
jgi:DeoR/GlpR family transcriptional regulator of sugar metabolism